MAAAAVVAAAVAFLSVLVGVAMAQPAPSPSVSTSGPAITCQFPNTSTISNNFCNAVDQQSMETQTQECTAFVMTSSTEPTPSAACCQHLNEVAYNRTACICLATFYPPASRNASRQRDLPALCGVHTDLCEKCPEFVVSRFNGTAAAPFDGPYKEDKSMASTIGAISLAVVFGLLLLAGIVGLIVTLIKKRRAKHNPPGPFEAAPPGGAF